MIAPRDRDRGVDAAAQAAEWDARYNEHEQSMWTGHPNGRLVAEVADLPAGRALDVGCGEGADAIWLAGNGWTVTAVDVSEVAISRAKDAAAAARVSVEWICGDALGDLPSGRLFDLVSVQYPALLKQAGDSPLRALLLRVAPAGLLLAVYHDLDEGHREHMKTEGVDPDRFFSIEDLLALLSDDFVIEKHSVQPRIHPPPGSAHIADVVLCARRR